MTSPGSNMLVAKGTTTLMTNPGCVLLVADGISPLTLFYPGTTVPVAEVQHALMNLSDMGEEDDCSLLSFDDFSSSGAMVMETVLSNKVPLFDNVFVFEIPNDTWYALGVKKQNELQFCLKCAL